MSYRSHRSIKARRSLSRKHKTRTAKNNKQNIRTMKVKTKIDFKKAKTQLENQYNISTTAIERGDHEMYAYSNKILLFMILDLASHGTKKAVKLANKYSEKTGIKINEKMVKKHLSKIPTARNTIKKIQNTANHPPSGSLAPGWVW